MREEPAVRGAAVLLVDSEEEFGAEEAAKLRDDLANRGLSLVVFAEWYNVELMKKMRFFEKTSIRFVQRLTPA